MSIRANELGIFEVRSATIALNPIAFVLMFNIYSQLINLINWLPIPLAIGTEASIA